MNSAKENIMHEDRCTSNLSPGCLYSDLHAHNEVSFCESLLTSHTGVISAMIQVAWKPMLGMSLLSVSSSKCLFFSSA